MRKYNSGNTNTIIIIIVLVIIVAFGVWWYSKSNSTSAPDNSELNVDVNLPSGEGDTTSPSDDGGSSLYQ
ncbi:hypothetical protein A2814_02995 [Candidatus Nomurabacteria bacterium RIFCSPHIGHO2_01_FULL_38_19]|uniref:Uncharacterized protein n=1 Tax=Candidatus Nomurabacteria bacterium RIFCSPHIGHO2_01_FULL_38_19 TaxID=1801732 RepID=A0A1F6UQG0_9BACT|nr:MAG: hypothetical protein A2814_02995 [Candidatus Nomurabacteria bacterium RIFCSPHIGHO2_01_FULL_38_19]